MKNFIVSLFILITLPSYAQEIASKDSLMVTTIEDIVTQTFKIITRKKGEKKNLDLLRELYLPNARFTLLYHPQDSFHLDYESLSLDEFLGYMKEEEEYYGQGFLQYELGKVINEYNGIANVFQSFYAEDGEDDNVQGIVSYQLVYFKNRWWISDLLWTNNTNDVPIPKKYLNK